MKIFLDTNVFYNNWFMQTPNFKYLFHFLNNEGYSLLLSDLVAEEVENGRRREVDEAVTMIKKGIKNASKHNSSQIPFNVSDLAIDEYDFSTLISEHVDYIEKVSYSEISHQEVVKRALVQKKPFLEGEKGYRDTLIWLSLLDHLKKNNVDEDIIFITNNKSDFFKTKGEEIHFHPDLASDISTKELDCKITPYKSLFEFVNSNIDKNDHAIDHFNTERIFEDFLETEGAEYIESMSLSELDNATDDSIFNNSILTTILDIRTDVFEGLEDPEVIHTSELGGNEVFVSYRYNLRRVTLEIDIPELEYKNNATTIKKKFYDIQVNSGVATMSCVVRPYFDVSFTYNTKDQSLKSYQVEEIYIRY